MTDEPELWAEPRQTANAQLLTGYLCGALELTRDPLYRPVAFAGQGGAIIEHCENGNRYRVTVEQISGKE